MRILTDEGIPHGLASELSRLGYQASPFPEDWRGWTGRKVVEGAVAAGFNILITQDRNMPFQRPLRRLALAVLIVPEMDRKAVLRLADEIAARLTLLEPGRYALFGRDGSLPDPPRKPLQP